MEVHHIDHKAYPKKLKKLTIISLRFIINDCRQALKANPEGHKAGYYADEICYCSNEINIRKNQNKHLTR